MQEKINIIMSELNSDLEKNLTKENLAEIKAKYLSKKGKVSELISVLKDLSLDDKKSFGLLLNDCKTNIEIKLTDKYNEIEEKLLDGLILSKKTDISLPGIPLNQGSIHPLNQVIYDICDLFSIEGFEICDGPEVESDLYNFEMMNIPKNHPARAMQDSLYIDDTTLLRTHTSPVQARVMLEKKGKPLKIICPGKVYRRDDDDATHSHQFTQVEGLVIGKNISMANLKDVLLKMVKHLFGNEREIRLRPSYFPFTEPSVEVDITYKKNDGSIGYIEVLGAGLINPNVLKMGGYDPMKYSGFAFGIGVERIAILKYKVEDIRSFYTNDIRFLKQFRGGLIK